MIGGNHFSSECGGKRGKGSRIKIETQVLSYFEIEQRREELVKENETIIGQGVGGDQKIKVCGFVCLFVGCFGERGQLLR